MLSRRAALAGFLACLTAALGGLRRAVAADHRRQPFIDRAGQMRRDAVASGDQAYGAIVVKGDRIVGLGPSRVVVNTDPTGHAEMEALRDAARNLGSHDLSGCVMFTTTPPCRMCETAAYWARIDRVYTGDDGHDRGKPTYGC
ncbi:MAG: nucleoside deaminase [Rhodospirillaceae bacterium]|jgi:tRNA(Arg) A34 adenosine deaminase TadA|nr:nucleoside deaminase [Rhodospirillaceae bacterium]